MNKPLYGSDMFWRGAWKFEGGAFLLGRFREQIGDVNNAIVMSIQLDGREKLWGWGSPLAARGQNENTTTVVY
jgi:hypothetical protein